MASRSFMANDVVAPVDGKRIVQPSRRSHAEIPPYEQQIAAEPHLVPAVFEERFNLLQWQLGAFPDDEAHHRVSDAQKLIALAIFAGLCLEKSQEHVPLAVIAQGLHLLYQVGSFHLSAAG